LQKVRARRLHKQAHTMTDTFDAVLAELDKAFGMVACNGSVAGAICNEAKQRLSAAHAAEVAERDARIAELEANAADRESEIEAIKAERARAEDQAEAASGQGVEGWTIQVDSDGIWATDPDGSSMRLAAAPTQDKGNG